MLVRIKSIYSYIARVTMGVALLLIFITSIGFALNEWYDPTPDFQNMFTWILAALAMPGLIDYYLKEFNPKPKEISYQGNCPKCRRKVEMELKEIN